MNSSSKRTILVWVVIILIIINISSLGTIWFHRMRYNKEGKRWRGSRETKFKHKWQSRGRETDYFKKRLELTADQSAQYDSIWNQYNSLMANTNDALNANREALALALSSTELDTVNINQLSVQQADLMRTMNTSILGMNVATRSILDDNQMIQYLEFIRRAGKRRGFIPEKSFRRSRRSQ